MSYELKLTPPELPTVRMSVMLTPTQAAELMSEARANQMTRAQFLIALWAWYRKAKKDENDENETKDEVVPPPEVQP